MFKVSAVQRRNNNKTVKRFVIPIFYILSSTSAVPHYGRDPQGQI